MKTKLMAAVGAMVIAVLLLVATVAMATVTSCANPSTSAANVQPISVNIDSQQGIWVNGQGTVTITPDIAMVSLGVSAQAASVAGAQTQAATAMDKVMAALTGNGVDKKDIQTQYFSIQPNYNYDSNTGQSTITGYMVSNTVNVKIRNIDKTGPVIDAVAAAAEDYTRVNGVSFTVEKPEQYSAQARDLAMKDARSKAEDIARLAGVSLGKAKYITESSSTSPILYPVFAKAEAGAAAPDTPITPGETDIVLNVQVVFPIQ